MKKLVFVFGLIMFFSCQNQAQNKPVLNANPNQKVMLPTIYKYKVTSIDGSQLDLSKYEGYKIMIVNTASKCGYTPQYKELQELYEMYADKNFVILGFPSNDFGEQEPGTESEIMTFCEKNYGVTFPMMSKVVVKGENMCELYKFLTKKDLNNVQNSNVEWNFQKYLINEKDVIKKAIQRIA